MSPNKEFVSTYKKVDGENVTMNNNDTSKVVGISNVFIKMHDVVVRIMSYRMQKAH